MAKGDSGKSPWSSILFYVGLFLFVLLTMLPLLWVFKMSIVTPAITALFKSDRKKPASAKIAA